MLFLHLHSPFLVSESSYTLVNALQFQKDVLQYIRSVYKELHADHETGAADNK